MLQYIRHFFSPAALLRGVQRQASPHYDLVSPGPFSDNLEVAVHKLIPQMLPGINHQEVPAQVKIQILDLSIQGS